MRVNADLTSGRVGRRQNGKDSTRQGWGWAAIVVCSLEVIGCGPGRMGGWRFGQRLDLYRL
jgi:hypothetical protein